MPGSDEKTVSFSLYEAALKQIMDLKKENVRVVAAINDAILPLCVDGGGCCDRRAAKVLSWARGIALGGRGGRP